MPNPEYYTGEGTLTVTRGLFGTDGNPLPGTETFYAGIFDDAEHTKLADEITQNVVPLALNGSSEASAEVTLLPEDGSPRTVYVTEVTEDGMPVSDAPGFFYTVSIDSPTAEFTQENTRLSVTITNRVEEEIKTDEWTDAETGIKRTARRYRMLRASPTR